MGFQSNLAPAGAVSFKVLKGGSHSSVPARSLGLADVLRHGLPHFGLSRDVALWRLKNLPHLLRGLWRVAVARACRLSNFYGVVSLTVIRANGEAVELGLASFRVVTTAGVGFIVDAFQNSVELETMKYHGIGTGTNAEASGDTALQTELTTQYSTNNTRATGTTTEGASANIYRTVGTNTVDASVAITEHGIFSDPTVASGVLLDRSVFSAVNLANGDSLQATYDLTFTAGS